MKGYRQKGNNSYRIFYIYFQFFYFIKKYKRLKYRFLSKFKNKMNLSTCLYVIYLREHIFEY